MPRFWTRKPELLLLPNIPEPLHGINPRTVLGNSWWRMTRTEAYRSTNFRCEACGIHRDAQAGRKILEAHEVYHTDYEKGLLTYLRAAPLCVNCHNYIHDGRLTWLVETGQITAQRFAAVIRHGDRVLREVGLKREPLQVRNLRISLLLQEGKVAQWEDWKLVVNSVEFPARKRDEVNRT